MNYTRAKELYDYLTEVAFAFLVKDLNLDVEIIHIEGNNYKIVIK